MSDKNQSACQMLSTALEMEEKGKAFYEKASSDCKSKECGEIFGLLAKEEVVHIERINEIYEVLNKGEAWCEDWQDHKTDDAMAKVFKALAKKHDKNVTADASDIEALDTGIEFESAGIKFYKEQLETAQDPIEKEFLDLMVKEERTHFRALNDIKLYLTNPEAWFREVEKGGLDGA